MKSTLVLFFCLFICVGIISNNYFIIANASTFLDLDPCKKENPPLHCSKDKTKTTLEDDHANHYRRPCSKQNRCQRKP